MSKAWAEKYPNTHIRVVKAMIRAAKWLDENNNANRPEAVKILSKPNYVGADEAVIANSMPATTTSATKCWPSCMTASARWRISARQKSRVRRLLPAQRAAPNRPENNPEAFSS